MSIFYHAVPFAIDYYRIPTINVKSSTFLLVV